MDLTTLIVQLVSGIVGGNIAGSLFKSMSLGTLGNSIAGLVGGGLGGVMLNSALSLGPAAISAPDVGTIVSQIAGGGVGGGVLMAIVGVLHQMFSKEPRR